MPQGSLVLNARLNPSGNLALDLGSAADFLGGFLQVISPQCLYS